MFMDEDRMRNIFAIKVPTTRCLPASVLVAVGMIATASAQGPSPLAQPHPSQAPTSVQTTNSAMQDMPGMQHRIQPLPPPEMPKLRNKPEAATGAVLHLEDLEERALKNNPTLRQASASVDTANGWRSQAGLLPNPIVGYTGEEIRGGSFRGGEQGFFVQQNIVLGGKLGLDKKVFDHEISQARAEVEEQRARILSNVRMLFYQALAAQDTVAMRRELADIMQQNAIYSRQLFNAGQKNETEVLEDEIKAGQADLDVIASEGSRWRAMAALAAVAGDLSVREASLDGNLEQDAPRVDETQLMTSLLRDSPAIRIAEAGVARAEAAVARDRRESIPDLFFRGGFQQNRELLESTGQPVGAQGFAEVGVELKLFNRNQGNVRASEADLDRARQEVKRVQLVLRERSASFLENYRTARALADRYRAQLLPRAQRAYQLIYERYGLMQASYPQVLASRELLYRLEADYISSLGRMWSSSVALENFLLTDGLEAPSRPSEMDRPVREINAPSFMGAIGPEK